MSYTAHPPKATTFVSLAVRFDGATNHPDLLLPRADLERKVAHLLAAEFEIETKVEVVDDDPPF